MRPEVHWPYRRTSTTDLPLLSDSGEVVRFRDLEGRGGRRELHRQVWGGSLAEFIAATGERPCEIAPLCAPGGACLCHVGPLADKRRRAKQMGAYLADCQRLGIEPDWCLACGEWTGGQPCECGS
jgi:hypothetical protein